MDKNEIQSIEHFAYPTPFNLELKELGLIPYRTNSRLEEKIRWLFSHPHYIHRDIFIDVASDGSKGLVKDMAIKAVGIMRHFLENPQQYGHSADNIHMQILVRMWRQVYRHKKFQRKNVTQYIAAKMRLLSIENGLIEELIRTCTDKDYVQHGDDMIKKREGVGLREKRKPKKKRRKSTGKNYMDYLCSLDE